MDPNATFEEIISALKDQDWHAAFQGLLNLYEWLKRGGFAPNIPPRTYIAIGRGGEYSFSILSYSDHHAKFIAYRHDKRTGRSEPFAEYICPATAQ